MFRSTFNRLGSELKKELNNLSSLKLDLNEYESYDRLKDGAAELARHTTTLQNFHQRPFFVLRGDFFVCAWFACQDGDVKDEAAWGSIIGQVQNAVGDLCQLSHDQ